MKKYVGWVLLAICLVVTYQGWQTSSGVAETQDPAQTVACNVGDDCVVTGTEPSAIKSDFMTRQYQFNTSKGPVTVTCKRQYLFFGNFSCTPKLGSLGVS